MSLKQDRQGARTVSDLERRYGFGKTFAEILGIAEDAQDAAELAQQAVSELDQNMTQDEIFNRLTDNGKWGGIYRDSEGRYYINADYIKSGMIIADLIKAGVLSSADGKVAIDLNGGAAKFFNGLTTNGIIVQDEFGQENTLFQVKTAENTAGLYLVEMLLKNYYTHDTAMRVYETYNQVQDRFYTQMYMRNGTISGLTAPVDASDAANKGYVDNVFCQTDANGDASLAVISEYPKQTGVYRVGPRITGLPHDTNGFGCLVIFNAGTYVMHLFIDEAATLYWARTVSTDGQSISSAPTAWRKSSSTEVSSGVV